MKATGQIVTIHFSIKPKASKWMFRARSDVKPGLR